MNATHRLHDLGQSIWLDNISLQLLDSGTLARYINDYSITGLTSNPTIFEQAIGMSNSYDEAIHSESNAGNSGEALFFHLALRDLTRAANLLRPVFDATDGTDGWVSLEVSPLLAHDTDRTITAAIDLHQHANLPNLFIKIPGTREGLKAIEESIFEGVPVNVTLLFSREQYLAAAEAYLRGIERRLKASRNPVVHSVASLFISRWDVAANNILPAELHNKLGIAVAQQTLAAYRQLLASARWRRLADAGAPVQKLLWASTGSKSAEVSDTLYVDALAEPGTINTMPEKTLLAFAEHGHDPTSSKPNSADKNDKAAAAIAACHKAGIDVKALAQALQNQGEQAFIASWQALLGHIAAKTVPRGAA